MRISELIDTLKELKKKKGDLQIQAFHHEGFNSLRAAPEDISESSFVDAEKDGTPIVVIGGWYK